MFLAGGLAGGAIVAKVRPVPAMAPAAPQPIATAIVATGIGWADPLVTVRGIVTAHYGGSFTLKDASGQALVRAGRSHDLSFLAPQNALVAVGQTVTVQGRFDDGSIFARYIVTPDGKAWAVHRHGDGGYDGNRGGHGRRHDDYVKDQPVAVPSVAVQSAK